MTRGDLINESEPVPTIAGRRISMLDVLAALESPDPEAQFYDDWQLSEEQVKAALEYIRNHRETLEETLREQTPA
mgnify:CR=1 FL=1